MLSEDKTNADIARGNRAKLLLEDDLLKEAFEALCARYIELWETTGITDVTSREKFFDLYSNVKLVQKHLRKVMDNGKIAAKDLEQREKRGILSFGR